MNEKIIHHFAGLIEQEKNTCLEQADRNYPNGKLETLFKSLHMVEGAHHMALLMSEVDSDTRTTICSMASEFYVWVIKVW